VNVRRDAGNHIIGFGATTFFASTPQLYGGFPFYGPTGVLLYAMDEARFTPTQVVGLGQIKSGSKGPDKVVDLSGPFSPHFLNSIGVVPPGFPGAGTVKGSSYKNFYDLALTPDGNGTYDVSSVTKGASVRAEGFAYVRAGSPFIYADSMFVSDNPDGTIRIYNLTSNGDPDQAQGSDFVTGVEQVFGAVFDPVTNDLLFVSDSRTIYLVTGFAPPPPTQGSE
jgi:hypothetical protein